MIFSSRRGASEAHAAGICARKSRRAFLSEDVQTGQRNVGTVGRFSRPAAAPPQRARRVVLLPGRLLALQMEFGGSMPVKLELGIEPLVKQEIIIAPIGASMVPLPVGVGEDTTVTGPHSSRKEVIMTVEEAAKARLQKGYALQPVLAVTTPPPELVTGPGKRNRKSSMHFGTALPARTPPPSTSSRDKQ